MVDSDLQRLCETGQRELMRLDYLAAESALVEAEGMAWASRDWDTLARLYMPLQEARRQRRQRCGEGIVRLDLLAGDAGGGPDPQRLIADYPHGQLLIAGWGSIEPALRFRALQKERRLYVETFLAAVYPIVGGSRAVVIVPTEDVALPPPGEYTIDALLPALPPHCMTLHEDELPRGPQRGSDQTYARVMGMWERLHLPYLAAADMQVDPVRKMEQYRRTIRVDYACELAHQKLAVTARGMLRSARVG